MLGKGLESLIPKKKSPASSDEQDFSSISPTPQEADVFRTVALGGEASSVSEPQRGVATPRAQAGGRRWSDRTAGADRKTYADAIFLIEVEKIKSNPHQPRLDFNEESLKELAASIQEFGILQPLIVSKIERDVETGTEVEYQLIAGERRLMAAKMLGWEHVPAIIKKSDRKSNQLEIAITENLQRTDLNPIETARAYAKLQDEFNLTQREIATRLGKSRETIANTLRLLNLPSEIQDALAKNQINESQARLLLIVEDLNQQQNLFKQLLSNNLSVRELRQKIKPTNNQQQTANDKQETVVDAETIAFREQLMTLLGAEVEIRKTGKTGKIIITFYSPEEIQGIIEKLSLDGKIE